jgi:hypothetical protein
MELPCVRGRRVGTAGACNADKNGGVESGDLLFYHAFGPLRMLHVQCICNHEYKLHHEILKGALLPQPACDSRYQSYDVRSCSDASAYVVGATGWMHIS